MAIDRSRKRTRLAMVVVRSPTGQNVGEALLEDQRRVQMERQAGETRQLVVMASPEEVRAAQMARQTTTPMPTRPSLATETQQRLIAYAHRTRHVLSHRSVLDHLSHARRIEMMSEMRRLKEEIQVLQEQIEVTTRSVEGMERLAFHLEQLTRDFLPRNPRDEEGYSALHYVGNGDALDVAIYLLDNGADIDAQDQNGKTPLHHSIREGSLLVSNLLVSRGAQVDIKDVDGVTPLTLAIQQRSMNMLQIILNEHHLVATTERRDFAASVMLCAVENEVDEAVCLIVEGGYSSVMISNSDGETPLHFAIVKRNSQLMEFLMRQDHADGIVTAITKRGDSPAHYAARYGAVRELETLLHRLVIMFGDLQTLNVENNPLNATNNEGSTCLYLAGLGRVNSIDHHKERDAIAQLLLQHGARLFRRDTIVSCSRSGLSEQILLHDQARRGVATWVREIIERNNENTADDDDADGLDVRSSNVLLTELCAEWVATVVSLSSHSSAIAKECHPNWPDLAAVLHIVISAGYALEFMPLLLELPLLRSGLAAVLHRLERFSSFPRVHVLLLQLHTELSGALVEITGD
ncbi:hypothetical protein F444_10997 [Phytophthora nicotianae P1976]|uniref:Uncharacterized protein n=1 Tax=Phytophthora nicotianae P1976 TaxID=1317066 RepID=A0A081A2B4_PHYNI|nr:hypothetical protein F444_10997 [Phytophthora nicotianae P1976]